MSVMPLFVIVINVSMRVNQRIIMLVFFHRTLYQQVKIYKSLYGDQRLLRIVLSRCIQLHKKTPCWSSLCPMRWAVLEYECDIIFQTVGEGADNSALSFTMSSFLFVLRKYNYSNSDFLHRYAYYENTFDKPINNSFLLINC